MLRPILGSTLLLALAVPLAAQSDGGLPAHYSINPVAVSRSGLYFEPFRPAHAGWRFATELDYGNMIEWSVADDGRTYLLDAEASTIHLNAEHGLGRDGFVAVDVPVSSVYAGVMDGFLDWYHGLLGIRIPERQLRPRNAFAYRVELPTDTLVRGPLDPSLGDVRVTVGLRHGPDAQSAISVTLPTAGGGVGYARGVPSVSLLNTWRARLHPRLVYEGSLNLGWTPKGSGPLADYERTTFAAITSGVRWRFAGRWGMFGNLFYHTSYYHDAGFPSLERSELSFDYGFLLRTKGGSEWRFGMTEDLIPTSPAIDAVFKIGRSFQ